jgi:hypothetical protein
MKGTAHEGGRSWMGIEVSLDWPSDSRVTVYGPLRGVPVAYLEVLKKVSYATGKHVANGFLINREVYVLYR